MKRALCCGINDYPGTVNDLHKCVDDAKKWKAFLESIGYEVTLLTDSDVTTYNVLGILHNMFASSKAGDAVVFTYSGHGTQVMDRSGDEPDGYDECLFLHDGILLDDNMRMVIDAMPERVHFTMVSDCCFSGTITRMALFGMGVLPPRIRYTQTDIIPPKAKRIKKFLEQEDMPEILMSGCSDHEYSYESPTGGVFSNVTLEILQRNLNMGKGYVNLTNAELYAAIRERLPSATFPQTPQLEGSEENKNRIVFLSDNPDPEPPEPQPDPGNQGCLTKILKLFGGVVLGALLVWGAIELAYKVFVN